MQTFHGFFEIIWHGGFMMIPLLISALVALTVIFERLYLFKKVYPLNPEFLHSLEHQLKTEDLAAVKNSLASEILSPITATLKVGFDHLSIPTEELEKRIHHEAQRWIPVLEKRLEILDTVITAAPLMGLLGTITGMMSSFQILSQQGVNEPNAITGGVGEALIATATGLIIALLKEYVQVMESSANLLLEARSTHQSIQQQK